MIATPKSTTYPWSDPLRHSQLLTIEKVCSSILNDHVDELYPQVISGLLQVQVGLSNMIIDAKGDNNNAPDNH